MWITTDCGKFLKRRESQTTLPVFLETCMQDKKQQLEPDMEQPIGSKLGKEYVKAKYHHPAYWTCMQSEWSEVKVSQSYSTLCDPMDYTVHGILQARILEWVAFPFPRESFQPRGSNQGLLHCRWILYQLSYQGRISCGWAFSRFHWWLELSIPPLPPPGVAG